MLPLVDHMLFCILTIVILDISRFGFEDWSWVLIASVADFCILFPFETRLTNWLFAALYFAKCQTHFTFLPGFSSIICIPTFEYLHLPMSSLQ